MRPACRHDVLRHGELLWQETEANVKHITRAGGAEHHTRQHHTEHGRRQLDAVGLRSFVAMPLHPDPICIRPPAVMGSLLQALPQPPAEPRRPAMHRSTSKLMHAQALVASSRSTS